MRRVLVVGDYGRYFEARQLAHALSQLPNTTSAMWKARQYLDNLATLSGQPVIFLGPSKPAVDLAQLMPILFRVHGHTVESNTGVELRKWEDRQERDDDPGDSEDSSPFSRFELLGTSSLFFGPSGDLASVSLRDEPTDKRVAWDQYNGVTCCQEGGKVALLARAKIDSRPQLLRMHLDAITRGTKQLGRPRGALATLIGAMGVPGGQSGITGGDWDFDEDYYTEGFLARRRDAKNLRVAITEAWYRYGLVRFAMQHLDGYLADL